MSLIIGGDLYAATVSDFSGTDSLIIKNQLRTEQYDYAHLNGKLKKTQMYMTKHAEFFSSFTSIYLSIYLYISLYLFIYLCIYLLQGIVSTACLTPCPSIVLNLNSLL